MAAPQTAEEERKTMAERILSLTLEVIHLLEGEDYIACKLSGSLVSVSMRKSQSSQTSVTLSPPPPPSPHTGQKLLGVAGSIADLLTEESTRGWDDVVKKEMKMEDAGLCVGGHWLLYKGAMMEEQPALTSPDRSMLLPGVITSTGAPPPIMAAPQTTANERKTTAEKILNLTLEIIHLLGGEEYVACKLSSHLVSPGKLNTTIMMTPSLLLSLYRNIKKIIEVTNQITETLTEERVNPGGWNVAVKRERRKEDAGTVKKGKMEGQKDHYMMEDQSSPTSSDGRPYEGDVEEYPLASPGGEISQDDAASDLSEDGPSAPNLSLVRQGKKLPLPSALRENFPGPSASGEHSPDPNTPGKCCPDPSIPVHHHTDDAEDKDFPCSEEDASSTDLLVIQQLSPLEEEPDLCSENRKPVPSGNIFKNPTEVKIYTCSECDKCFSSEDDFLSHQSSHPQRRRRRSTRPRKSTQTLQISHAEEEPFSCSVCNKRFAKRAHLSSHFKFHTGERPFVCSQCEKCFSWKADLMRHERMHNGEKPFKCTECGESFMRRKHLLTHFKNHSGENLFSCPECGKCFALKESLIVHQQSHVEEKPYTCLECNKAFVCKKTLSRHYRTHSDFKPYCCSVCNRTFAVKAYLMSHLKTHTGEKPFSCPKCGKSFSWKGGLSRHFRTHFGDKPFSCSECGKCFKEKTHLTAHLRTHSGEKPFPCPECGICFTRRAHLISHLSTHNGDKPFCCSYCTKSFTTKKGRAKHERTHTAKIPYSCAECGDCFTTRLELISHTKTHVNDGPFFCPQCAVPFSDQSSLILHLNSHRQQDSVASENES